MKRWKNTLVAVGLMAGLSLTAVPLAQPAAAINVFQACGKNSDSSVCKAKNTDHATSLIKKVINVLLYVLGTITVVMIVIGGIRYTTSAGDSSKTKAAKDTILYAVVGLVIAIMAYTIVNFVLNWFG